LSPGGEVGLEGDGEVMRGLPGNGGVEGLGEVVFDLRVVAEGGIGGDSEGGEERGG
jgi:hypothetical protein